MLVAALHGRSGQGIVGKLARGERHSVPREAKALHCILANRGARLIPGGTGKPDDGATTTRCNRRQLRIRCRGDACLSTENDNLLELVGRLDGVKLLGRQAFRAVDEKDRGLGSKAKWGRREGISKALAAGNIERIALPEIIANAVGPNLHLGAIASGTRQTSDTRNLALDGVVGTRADNRLSAKDNRTGGAELVHRVCRGGRQGVPLCKQDWAREGTSKSGRRNRIRKGRAACDKHILGPGIGTKRL